MVLCCRRSSILGRDAGFAIYSAIRLVVAAARSPQQPQLLCGDDAVTSQHAIRLQDVVGERMPEHHGGDFAMSAHVQADEVPVAPSGMDALADRPTPVLRLSLLARHPASPGAHAGTIIGSRLVRVAAILGL